MWTFREIAVMPDVVLQHLGKLLQQCRKDIAMLIQTYIHLMASIPQKAGGRDASLSPLPSTGS